MLNLKGLNMNEQLIDQLLTSLVQAINKAERGNFPGLEIQSMKLWIKNNAPKHFELLQN